MISSFTANKSVANSLKKNPPFLFEKQSGGNTGDKNVGTPFILLIKRLKQIFTASKK